MLLLCFFSPLLCVRTSLKGNKTTMQKQEPRCVPMQAEKQQCINAYLGDSTGRRHGQQH